MLNTVNVTWNIQLPADFCEGKEIPYFVPPSYEFFSAISGTFLVIIGVVGTLQARLEALLKVMYAGIAVSGVGTVLLHYQRILVFNYADIYPLILTLAIGMMAFFDDLVTEARRPTTVDGKLMSWKDHFKNEIVSFQRSLLNAFAFTGSMIYLVVGLTLVIFSHYFSFDIVGIYFGVPYALIALGGMFFLCAYRPDPIAENNLQLRKLRNVATVTGIIGIFFKLMDSFFCNSVNVWLFPHPFFHIFTTYATHCFIVFLAFYRANNTLSVDDQQPVIYWFLKVYPHIFIPESEDYIRKMSSRDGNADIFIAQGGGGDSLVTGPPGPMGKNNATIKPQSPESARPQVNSIQDTFKLTSEEADG